jgi:hypothetical protein
VPMAVVRYHGDPKVFPMYLKEIYVWGVGLVDRFPTYFEMVVALRSSDGIVRHTLSYFIEGVRTGRWPRSVRMQGIADRTSRSP